MLKMLSTLNVKTTALLLTAIGLLLTGDAYANAEVRLSQNRSPISGVTIVAKEKGFFKEMGLDVKVSDFTSGKLCLQAVLGGAADIATTAEAPTTAAAMAKEPIAFLARTEYSNLKTLTAAGANIKSFSDLKGKRIGFTAGTGSEVYTSALLKKAGLTKEDVRLVNLRPQDMAAALSSNSIDAFNVWEPHIFNASRIMGEKAVLLDTDGVYAETFNIVVTKDYLANNAETIDRFLKALLTAEKWMKENKAEAIKVVAKRVGMPTEDLAAMWQEYVFEVVIDDRSFDILNAHAEWRLATGNHPPGATLPDFSKVVDPQPLHKIDPKRVNASAFKGL